MSSQYTYDNEGVGAVMVTMDNCTDANQDFTQTDIDAGRTACVVTDNNEVGMGSDGDKLFGKVVDVSDEEDSNGIPVDVTVQVSGVARFKYVATTPVINQMVEVDGAGKVSQASADADIAAGGHLMRGMVLAVDTTNTTCDVLLI